MIDLYSPEGTHLKTINDSWLNFEDTGTNYIYEEYWDLICYDGTPYTGTEMTATFTAIVTDDFGAISSGANSLKLYKVGNKYVPDGAFVIAHTWDVSDYYGQINQCIQYGVVNPLIEPSSVSGLSMTPYPRVAGFNDDTGNGSKGNAGHLLTQDDADLFVTNILPRLNVQNFFFDGHGNPDAIGDGGDFISISRATIAELLENINDPHIPYDFSHPYRVVFLNACETANNTDWASTFGIPETIDFKDLEAKQTGAQAFIGWYGDLRAPWTSINPLNDDWGDQMQTMGVFFGAWMSGASLDTCIKMASSPYPLGNDHSIKLDFPLGIKYTWAQLKYGGLIGNPVNNDFWIVVYGYRWITRDGYAKPPGQ